MNETVSWGSATTPHLPQIPPLGTLTQLNPASVRHLQVHADHAPQYLTSLVFDPFCKSCVMMWGRMDSDISFACNISVMFVLGKLGKG